MTRAEADLVFREALVDSDVPLVKSWVLWTGVTLPTRWRSRAGAKIALSLWFAAALAGTGLLVDERDHQTFTEAIRTGRLQVLEGV